MTTPIHPDFVGVPASAVAAAIGYEKPKPRSPRPLSTTDRAVKAALRVLDAINKAEGLNRWRDVDVDRGLRASLALAQAYADVLYERRLAEVGTLPGGLQLVQWPGEYEFYSVEDGQGDQQFEVERRTPASQIRKMAECYVEGVRRGKTQPWWSPDAP